MTNGANVSNTKVDHVRIFNDDMYPNRISGANNFPKNSSRCTIKYMVFPFLHHTPSILLITDEKNMNDISSWINRNGH